MVSLFILALIALENPAFILEYENSISSGKSRHLRADSTAGVEKRLDQKHHLWWMVQMGVED